MKKICIIGELGADIAVYLAVMFRAVDNSSIVVMEDYSSCGILHIYMEDNSMTEYMGIRIFSGRQAYEETADIKIILIDNASNFKECIYAEKVIIVTNLKRNSLKETSRAIKKLGVCFVLIVKDYVEQVVNRKMLLPILQADSNMVKKTYFLEPNISNSRREIEIQYGRGVRLLEMSVSMSNMLRDMINNVCGTLYTVNELNEMLIQNEKKL